MSVNIVFIKDHVCQGRVCQGHVCQGCVCKSRVLSPFGRIPEQISADLGSVGNDGGVVEKGLVSDLHLEQTLVPGGKLLGHRPQDQDQDQDQGWGQDQGLGLGTPPGLRS